MAKYRKKPVVIEAFQITEVTRNSNYDTWPEWLQRAWQKEDNETGALYPWRDIQYADLAVSDAQTRYQLLKTEIEAAKTHAKLDTLQEQLNTFVPPTK